MGPEGFEQDGFAGDVWALGVVVLECYVGRYPFVNEEDQRPDWASIMWAVCFGGPPVEMEKASHEFRSFVGRCLEKDWRKRGTVEELLCHPFFASTAAAEGIGGVV
ncbi:Mitogen-activated protein kinase kinase 5 [Acorus calamus]|uniref:Mitogen-activated protein kinase kinase 5 n=1 Tax=Acorus calamus TaxID=4465 RepID=A0AAV9DYJ1_ACOCL|nr:Mitogen-activated protein kinase kinase 5 [Acorus calamus]